MQMFENSRWKRLCEHRSADALCHQLHRHHKWSVRTRCHHFVQNYSLPELSWTNCAKKAILQEILEKSLLDKFFSKRTESPYLLCTYPTKHVNILVRGVEVGWVSEGNKEILGKNYSFFHRIHTIQ